ncbi:hypothetical protein MRB53_039535 [Persea americana]|nr:hypothetical protein MRB53_039535 [Persea americana]
MPMTVLIVMKMDSMSTLRVPYDQTQTCVTQECALFGASYVTYSAALSAGLARMREVPLWVHDNPSPLSFASVFTTSFLEQMLVSLSFWHPRYSARSPRLADSHILPDQDPCHLLIASSSY